MMLVLAGTILALIGVCLIAAGLDKKKKETEEKENP